MNSPKPFSRFYPLSSRQGLVVFLFGTGLALWLRYSLRDYQNSDYWFYTGPWVDFIRAHGGYRALAFAFSNYTPPYPYLLVLFSYLFPTLSNLYLVKLISILFDLLASFLVYRIVRIRYPKGWIPLWALLTFLFLPTIVLNSAHWGQADSIYTVPLLFCLYFFLKERPRLGMIAFGIAISIKLQAIFLAPFLVILYLHKKTSLASFLLIPGTYLLAILPAWFMGRPLAELLTIYLTQGETYRELTMNAPNLYTWLPNSLYDALVPAGLLITILIALALIAIAHKNRKAYTANALIALATLSLMAMPFFLPKMHDRYFYPADVFSLILGFYSPQLVIIPILTQFASLFAYFPFLFQVEPVPLEILTVVQLFSLGWLSWYIFCVQSKKTPLQPISDS